VLPNIVSCCVPNFCVEERYVRILFRAYLQGPHVWKLQVGLPSPVQIKGCSRANVYTRAAPVQEHRIDRRSAIDHLYGIVLALPYIHIPQPLPAILNEG